ncbi:hypothetical protein GW796_07550 [archaeon]|nr:hypothetical protein [archaeon]
MGGTSHTTLSDTARSEVSNEDLGLDKEKIVSNLQAIGLKVNQLEGRIEITGFINLVTEENEAKYIDKLKKQD